jgi:hypothetical protein
LDFLQNRSYFRTQSKYQQIQEIQNNHLHHIRLQWNKTKPQKQNKPQKILKHMETEQHTAENKWVTEEIRELIKKSFESNEMKYNLPDM